MNKRLRKKKHLKEFREMGFDIEIRYNSGFFEQHKHEYIESFIEVLNKSSFETGGGWSNDAYSGYVCVCSYKTDIDAAKPELLNNLRLLPGVVSVSAGKNTDAWYGPF